MRHPRKEPPGRLRTRFTIAPSPFHRNKGGSLSFPFGGGERMDAIEGQGGGTHKSWQGWVWGFAAGLWLLPLGLSRVTDEMQWDRTDFIVWAFMLLLAATAVEIGARISRSRPYRAAVGIAVAGGFLMTWANLAVGIIGNEDNPINLVFFGVLAVGFAGALVARFRAAGMAYAMLATAIAQVLAAILALVLDGAWVFVLTSVFVAIWLTSAMLFRRAARESLPPPR
jgi:hypothetical protein